MPDRFFDEQTFRNAVTKFEVNSDPASAQRIVTGAGAILRLLDKTRADLEQRERGGRELGKTFVLLADLIKDAFRRSADDPIAGLEMLGNHLAHLFEDEGGLSADEHNRVCRALENWRQQLDEVEKLRAEVQRLETAAMVRAASVGTEAAQ